MPQFFHNLQVHTKVVLHKSAVSSIVSHKRQDGRKDQKASACKVLSVSHKLSAQMSLSLISSCHKRTKRILYSLLATKTRLRPKVVMKETLRETITLLPRQCHVLKKVGSSQNPVICQSKVERTLQMPQMEKIEVHQDTSMKGLVMTLSLLRTLDLQDQKASSLALARVR